MDLLENWYVYTFDQHDVFVGLVAPDWFTPYNGDLRSTVTLYGTFMKVTVSIVCTFEASQNRLCLSTAESSPYLPRR